MSTLTPYAGERALVWHGDCIALMNALGENSVDAIVTDPPYGLGFMGKEWDALPPGEDWARACLRVLKPGGHLLAFGGTRTWHRLAVAIEDAGFELRDSIAWLYGSGFPKSLDVSKAIDKAAGATREVIGTEPDRWTNKGSVLNFANDRAQSEVPVTGAPATPEAEQWQGWGTALKPAFEPIVVARKPLVGTVAANVLAHGTGALNIDGCRIDMGSEYDPTKVQRQSAATAGMSGLGESGFAADHEQATYNPAGRWPANVVLDETRAEVLDRQAPDTGAAAKASGPSRTGKSTSTSRGMFAGTDGVAPFHDDRGGASRFFYVAKAPKRERPVVEIDGRQVAHATVKPLALMRWLVRLITPPGGLVLDTFAGSGTTGEAALLEGFRVLLAEQEADYLPLIDVRLKRAVPTSTIPVPDSTSPVAGPVAADTRQQLTTH